MIYGELAYTLITESVAYPLEEMANELAGVISLYFGFSCLSIVTFITETAKVVKQRIVRLNSASSIVTPVPRRK